MCNWLVPRAAEGFFLPQQITLHTQSCSPLSVNRCHSGSGRSRLDYQMTRAADSSLVVIKKKSAIQILRGGGVTT